jgi:hypothetical protein
MQIIIHAADIVNEREMIDTLVEKNLAGKLDAYIEKHQNDNEDVSRLELWIDRNKSSRYDGKVTLSLGGHDWRSSRDDFEKMDDLVNHLFTHLKEQMSK